MRRLIPILAALVLLLPALANPVSAEYVNHVGKIEASSNLARADTNVDPTIFINFSIRVFNIYDNKYFGIKLANGSASEQYFVYIKVYSEMNEVLINDNFVGPASVFANAGWVTIFVNRTIAKIGPYSLNLTLPDPQSICQIRIFANKDSSHAHYFDDVMLNGEIIEDFEDANSVFAAVYGTFSIVEDPSPIVIHSPNWGDTVTAPFSINYTNPAGAVINKIIVDYTELTTISNVTENVSFEFQTQDIPPGWHTITIKAYNETGAEIGSTSIYLYVENPGYTPPDGDNSSASSDDSGSTGGSTGSSGSAGDTWDSGFTEFADDVKTWFKEDTLGIPRWIWILTLVGVLLIGSGVRRL